MNTTPFFSDESGAVTVDWVVLTAALAGLGLLTLVVVSGGVAALSGEIETQLSDQEIVTEFSDPAAATTPWNGMSTSDYIAAGQAVAPGNNGAVYGWATAEAQANAPDGYNFDNPLHDPASNNLVYTNDAGTHYSVGGDVTAIDDYAGTPQYFGA
ncbi:MAG: hypothetical protein JKY00_01240 [Roseicyclus sp.]|nr:hypothetical protein [Roseicyclus sp.]